MNRCQGWHRSESADSPFSCKGIPSAVFTRLVLPHTSHIIVNESALNYV